MDGFLSQKEKKNPLVRKLVLLGNLSLELMMRKRVRNRSNEFITRWKYFAHQPLTLKNHHPELRHEKSPEKFKLIGFLSLLSCHADSRVTILQE